MDHQKCDSTCNFHETIVNRMKAMEDTAKISLDLKEAVKNLSDNVAALHQAVVKMAAERNNSMPISVRVFIAVPSLLITVATLVWLHEHAGALLN